MKIKTGFIVRDVADEKIVVPVGERAKSFRGMVKLNETAAFLWNFFTAEHTLDEAVAALKADFEVDEETARADAEKFMSVLEKNGLAD